MDFEKDIAEHYDKQEPSEGFWKRIRRERFRRRNRRILSACVAVAAVIAVSLGATWWYGIQKLEHEVFAQVADRHLTPVDSRYAAASIEELADRLERCRFSLKSQEPCMDEYVTVAGGYCSIKQKLAVQIKMKREACGSVDTLYVTDLNEELSRLRDRSEAILGDVNLRMWKEQDRLYVLASSQALGPY